jgi:23S rRNA (uracil1939-C5)-methyltransferase
MARKFTRPARCRAPLAGSRERTTRENQRFPCCNIMPSAVIESLDQEGRGIAHVEGKVVFVEGGLPGEHVELAVRKRKPSYEIATAQSIRHPNAGRVAPRCPHFGTCGGCSLQHADPALQVAAKQRALEEALARIGRVRPDTLLPPIAGPAWGYRHRARLSVRDVPKKGGVLVGFHERQSSYVADMRECAILPPRISALLPALRTLVESLSIRRQLPQIELAVGERHHGVPAAEASPAGTAATAAPATVYALVLRILAPLTPADEARLVAFADRHGVELWLQPGGPQTVTPFHPRNATLAYTLPEFDVALPFSPTDFTLVNTAINRVLVRRAVALLAPRAGERTLVALVGVQSHQIQRALDLAALARANGVEGVVVGGPTR